MSVKTTISKYCPTFLRPVFNRIESSPIGYRLASGAFWSLFGAVISRGLIFAAWVVVARLLGKTGYGELGMIQSTVGMFGVFAGFGLGLTSTKYVAEFRISDPVRAGNIIGFSGVVATATGSLMALSMLIFSSWLSEHTINAPHLVGDLRIGALILFINALNGAQTGALSGFEAFKTIAYVNFFVGIISFPILISGAYWGGLTGAVWALVINLVINWLLNHIALRKEAQRCRVPITFIKFSQEFPVLWRFSLPVVLGGAMVGPVTWACNAMLVNQPEGYSAMGVFTASLVFQNLLIFAGGMLNAPLLSMISNAGPKISDTLCTVNILSSWILGVIIAIPLLCFPEITQALYGAGFNERDFKVTFSIVVFYTCIMMFKSGLARVLAANSLLWWGFLSNTFWAIALFSFAVFFVKWGAPGLAASFAIAYVLNTLIMVPLYYTRGLVPKKTLLSIESAFIWLILIVLLFLNIVDVPLRFRAIAFMPAFVLTGIAFFRLMRTPSDTISGGVELES